MKQFKVGDTVRLEKNLKVGQYYNCLEMLKSMRFEGAKQIERIKEDTGNITLENWPFYYSPNMLIKVKPED